MPWGVLENRKVRCFGISENIQNNLLPTLQKEIKPTEGERKSSSGSIGKHKMVNNDLIPDSVHCHWFFL